MIRHLFGARKPGEPPIRSVPEGSCIYAIGDIHGSLTPLIALHDVIKADAGSRSARRKCLVYLGDYVDRGIDSNAVLDSLIEQPLPGFEHVFLKGNHEDGLLRFLIDSDAGPPWLAYGGAATIYSYGVRPPDPPTSAEELRRAQSELLTKIPRSHLDFLARLKLYHIEGDYLFVHAGLRPGIAIEDQAPEDMMWIREEFLESRAEFGKLVVHGHSITAEPDICSNRIGIDTGAYATGRLTCLVLEGTAQSFLRT